MRWYVLPFALLPLAGCWFDKPKEVTMTGSAWGTTYHVTVVDAPDGVSDARIEDAIRAGVARVDASMNNWLPSSEISKFNASTSTAPVPVSADLADVLTVANQINALTDGKYDVTLGPLIDLWGFGPKKPDQEIPSQAQIDQALASVGEADKLVLKNGTLAKTVPDLSVNLSSIAKGWGIDAVGQELTKLGITRYLVEFGGDMRAHGTNADGKPWRIGIERPDAAEETVQTVIEVTDHGIATSGDYRNYFEKDGVRYSHIIDPTTGRPITHNTASVTVIADTAAHADGLATALLVEDGPAAMKIATDNDIALMEILRENGKFVIRTSPAFDALVASDQKATK